MAKKDRVTIKDIARVAKVTPQTVSRAFRNTSDISAETRERILKIASEMGYVRNVSARSLRNGSTNLIAVIYDNIINNYFSIITHYLQRSFKEKGYSILTISVDDIFLREAEYLKAIEHNVDGVISFLELDEDMKDALKKYDVPVLVIGRKTDESFVDCVYVDDKKAGMLAAKRFIERGCKNPIFVSEASQVICSVERYEGFKEEFEKIGITPRIIADKPNVPFFLENPFVEQFELDPPDAIFCFNDMLAFESLYLIEKHNLKGAKVIGVDNVQHEIYFPKRLTTIGWDKAQLVKYAIDMILERINETEAQGRHKELDVYLVEGVTA